MVEIKLKKFFTNPAMSDFSSENSHVFFSSEWFLVFYKQKMAQFIQFEDNRILIVCSKKSTFYNCGNIRGKVYVARTEVPSEGFREPARNIMLVEIIGCVKHLSCTLIPQHF